MIQVVASRNEHPVLSPLKPMRLQATSWTSVGFRSWHDVGYDLRVTAPPRPSRRRRWPRSPPSVHVTFAPTTTCRSGQRRASSTEPERPRRRAPLASESMSGQGPTVGRSSRVAQLRGSDPSHCSSADPSGDHLANGNGDLCSGIRRLHPTRAPRPARAVGSRALPPVRGGGRGRAPPAMRARTFPVSRSAARPPQPSGVRCDSASPRLATGIGSSASPAPFQLDSRPHSMYARWEAVLVFAVKVSGD